MFLERLIDPLWQPWSLDFQWTQLEVEDNVPSLGILLLLKLSPQAVGSWGTDDLHF